MLAKKLATKFKRHTALLSDSHCEDANQETPLSVRIIDFLLVFAPSLL